MQDKSLYTNGQKIFEQKDDVLSYFYKNGQLKAQGISINGIMQGEWIFYRETGQLWQVGHFKDNQKHGSFIRYDKNDNIEYDEQFENGRVVKKVR
jgi:antitoxin component YwqK of YwqJK toxin-antitoxin module